MFSATCGQQTFLHAISAILVHYAAIDTFIEGLGQRFDIGQITYDRWGAVQMSQNLEELGFTVMAFSQGFKDISPPSKEFMKLALEGRLAHGGHPVLAWMVDNIHIRTDPAGNIKTDKQKSTEKIDGVVATIMALDRAIRCGITAEGGSVYDGCALENLDRIPTEAGGDEYLVNGNMLPLSMAGTYATQTLITQRQLIDHDLLHRVITDTTKDEARIKELERILDTLTYHISKTTNPADLHTLHNEYNHTLETLGEAQAQRKQRENVQAQLHAFETTLNSLDDILSFDAATFHALTRRITVSTDAALTIEYKDGTTI